MNLKKWKILPLLSIGDRISVTNIWLVVRIQSEIFWQNVRRLTDVTNLHVVKSCYMNRIEERNTRSKICIGTERNNKMEQQVSDIVSHWVLNSSSLTTTKEDTRSNVVFKDPGHPDKTSLEKREETDEVSTSAALGLLFQVFNPWHNKGTWESLVDCVGIIA